MDYSRSNSRSPLDTKPDLEQLSFHISSQDPHLAIAAETSASQTPRHCGGDASDRQGPFDCASVPLRVGSASPSQQPEVFGPGRESVNVHGAAALPTGSWSAVGSPDGSNSQNMDKKQICAICGDRASGKHYGVYSCEGCKGFFKRTVRKDLQYACRDEKNCVVDRRQRNRCQFCRYQKCLKMGMRKEAVQEERMAAAAAGEKMNLEAESTSSLMTGSGINVEALRDAELATDPKHGLYVDAKDDPIGTFCHAAEKQLFTLVDWAKCIPHFVELPIEDQVTLLRSGWNELLIAGFSHRSVSVEDSILLCTGLRVTRDMANEAGIGLIFDRVLIELVAKMREMKMDKAELGCLRAIVLFNPDAKGLLSVHIVESLREKVYATMEQYCRRMHPSEPGRFAKLLLRLPALRSIGLKCIDHLFFYKLVSDSHVDTFLLEMLDIPVSGS